MKANLKSKTNELKAYIDNGKEIRRLKEESEKREKTILEQRNLELDKIDEMRKLLDEKDHNIREIFKDKEQAQQTIIKVQVDPLEEQRAKVRRIIEFLKIAENYHPVSINDIKITVTNENKFSEWQDWLYDDDFLKIQLFIGENDKPKNKFTVAVFGRCVFHEPLLNTERRYYSHNISESGAHISFELGSFPTVDEAKAYISRKKSKIEQVQTIIEQVEALKDEYFEVIEKYELSDFEELFEYHCGDYDCCRRFKTIPESHEREVRKYNAEDRTYTTEMITCPAEKGFRREIRSDI